MDVFTGFNLYPKHPDLTAGRKQNLEDPALSRWGWIAKLELLIRLGIGREKATSGRDVAVREVWWSREPTEDTCLASKGLPHLSRTVMFVLLTCPKPGLAFTPTRLQKKQCAKFTRGSHRWASRPAPLLPALLALPLLALAEILPPRRVLVDVPHLRRGLVTNSNTNSNTLPTIKADRVLLKDDFPFGEAPCPLP